MCIRYIFSLNFFRFIDLVTNSNVEKRIIQDYVKGLRKEYLLKNIHLTCKGKFIPLNFITFHFEKLSQMVGESNYNEISTTNTSGNSSIVDYYYDYDYYYYHVQMPSRNISKDNINFGAEMFMALNSCPTFYEKLYWKAFYGNESRIAKIASNIIRKAEDGFKARAQKIFAKISSILGFQHISYLHEENRSIAMNIELSKNMLDIKGAIILDIFDSDRSPRSHSVRRSPPNHT